MPDPPAARELDDPHPSRVSPRDQHRAAILTAHAAAMARGDAGYLDPATRLFVFTAAHLMAKGTCCDSGCRHCPFVA
jgi:hypothetical protein